MSPALRRKASPVAVALAGLTATALCLTTISAAPPDFTGSWRLDKARSDDPKARIEEAAGPANVKGGGTSPLTILPVPGVRQSVERVEMRDWLMKLVEQVQTLEVEQAATEIKLYHGDDIARTFYFGRESFREDGQGRKFKCRTEWKGDQLLLEETGAKGRLLREGLTLVPSAGLLIEAIRLEDPLLKKPLDLRLVYVRQDAPKPQP